MFRLREFLLSSASLGTSQAVTAGVGFVFWYLAAHLFAQAEVGVASAVISAMSLVGAVGAMGLGTLLIYEIPRRPGREMGMIAASLAGSMAIGAVLGLVFVVIAPLLSAELVPVRASILMVVTVALGAGLTSASLVIDQAVIGLMRSGLQLVRNVLAAVGRLGLLAAFGLIGAGAGALAMVGAWVVAVGLSMLALGAYSAWRGSLRRSYPLHWEFLGEQRGNALRHHLLNLAIQLPGWAMPVIALTVLSARVNAGFYFAWLLVGFASFVLASFVWVLYASAVREPGSMARWGWVSLRLSGAAALVGAIGLMVFGPWVIEIFGRGYAEVARGAFVVLPLTLFPTVIKGHYVTINRVRGTVGAASWLVSGGAVLEMLGGWVGASAGGLIGLGIGVVTAMVLETILMLPLVIETIIRPQLAGKPSEA